MNKQALSAEKSPAEKLLDIFSAAASLQILIQPRITDRENFIHDEISRFHVVDTDIVTFYSSPGTIGIGEKINTMTNNERKRSNSELSEPPYARIFPVKDNDNGEDKKKIQNFSVALADYIFSKNRIYLLPSHVEELQNVIQGIQKGADIGSNIGQEIEHYLDIQKRSFDKLTEKNNGGNIGQVKKWIENKLETIRFGNQPIWQLYRLSQLFKNQRLNSLINEIEDEKSVIGETNKKLKDKLRQLLLERDITDTIKIVSRTQEWFSILKKHKPRKTESWRLETDAQALALLEYLNKELRAIKCQIIFITGDNTLIEAVNQEKNSTSENPANFIFLYHPKALISDPEFLSPDKKGNLPLTHTLNTWLQSFLVGLSGHNDDPDKIYSEIANVSAPKNIESKKLWIKRINETFSEKMIIDSFNAVMKEWSSLTSEITVREALRHDGLQQLLNLPENNFYDLLEHLEELVVNAWHDFLLEGSAIGINPFLQSIPKTPPARSIPVLCFFYHEEASNFIQELYKTDHKNIPENDTSSLFSKRLEIIKTQDPTLYSSYLCLALFFAAGGRWSLAKPFARYALRMAEKQENSLITGHEAAFMLAVTHRHLAIDIKDLGECQDLLESSEKLYYKLVESNSKPPPKCYWNQRFKSEQLAIDLAILYQIKFSSNNEPDELSGKVETTYYKFKQLYEDMKKITSNNDDKWGWVKSYVYELMMVNMLQVGMLWEDSRSKLPHKEKQYLHRIFKDDIPFNPECLNEESDKSNLKLNYFRDRLHEVLYCWLCIDEPENQRKCADSVRMQLKKEREVKLNCIKSYDVKRFAWFIKFLDNL